MNRKSTSIGVSFAELLTSVFIVLKLTRVINWSWWWVLAPTWIVAVIVIAFIIILISTMR